MFLGSFLSGERAGEDWSAGYGADPGPGPVTMGVDTRLRREPQEGTEEVEVGKSHDEMQSSAGTVEGGGGVGGGEGESG